MIQLTREGTVFLLSLNRQERHNSLVPELLREFLESLDHILDEPDVRALVLQAKGRSFSTGGDLEGFKDHFGMISDYASDVVGLLNQVILALIDLPFPVIIAVHGIVTGGSMGFVLASDIVLVTPQASFTPYYAVVGFSPDGGWTAMLPELIGKKRTAEILMENRTISAEEAVAWGIANRIIEQGRIQEAAIETAHKISEMHPASIRYMKKMLSPEREKLAIRLDEERHVFIENIKNKETQERMTAFLEKMKS